MAEPTGSNTKKPASAPKSGIDTSALGPQTEPKNPSTFPRDTASPMSSETDITKPLSELENEYKPPKFKQSWVDKFPIINSAFLPPEILKGIRSALAAPNCHWIAIAPNTSSSLVTQTSIGEMPPGFTVVLVFGNQPEETHPDQHEDGKIYILGK